MSADTKISDEQIVSYVDGELDEHGIAKIKAALQDNPSLQIKIDDYKKSEYLAFGFVREYSTEFPKDIVGILSRFIVMDALYLYQRNGNLYKMSVDEILVKCDAI